MSWRFSPGASQKIMMIIRKTITKKYIYVYIVVTSFFIEKLYTLIRSSHYSCQYLTDWLCFKSSSVLGRHIMNLLTFAVSSTVAKSTVLFLMSIAERGHCLVGTMQLKQIGDVAPIKQWGTFLSTRRNKTDLIWFLVRRWKTNYSVVENRKFYVAVGEPCFRIEESLVQRIPKQNSNQ